MWKKKVFCPCLFGLNHLPASYLYLGIHQNKQTVRRTAGRLKITLPLHSWSHWVHGRRVHTARVLWLVCLELIDLESNRLKLMTNADAFFALCWYRGLLKRPESDWRSQFWDPQLLCNWSMRERQLGKKRLRLGNNLSLSAFSWNWYWNKV